MPNPQTATQEGLDTPNDTMTYEVSRDILPIHCPMPGTSLWNSHPRVYIPVEETGRQNALIVAVNTTWLINFLASMLIGLLLICAPIFSLLK